MDSDRRVCTIHTVLSQGDTFAISTPDAPSPPLWDPYVLVGMGDPGINCGNAHLGLLCDTCYKHHWGISQCKQKRCPNCYKEWIEKTTRKTYSRLTDPATVTANKHKILSNIMISPGEKLVNDFKNGIITDKQLRTAAEKYLQGKSSLYITPHGYNKTIDKQDQEILLKYGLKKLSDRKFAISIQNMDRLRKKEKAWKIMGLLGTKKPAIYTWIYHSFKVTKRKYAVPDGQLVFHPYRLKKETQQEYIDYLKTKNPEYLFDNDILQADLDDFEHPGIMQKWDWLMERYPKTWKDHVELSPHYHFTGWCNWLDSPKKDEKFIYKRNKDSLSERVPIHTEISKERKKKEGLLIIKIDDKHKMVIKKHNLFRAIRYPLTHTVDRTDQDNYASYVWTGILSARNGKTDKEQQLEQYQQIIIDEEKKEKNKICQKCGKGTLKNIKPTIDKFFKKYENIPDTGWYTYPDLIAMVHNNKHIREDQRQNMAEILQTLENYKLGKPPPAAIEYTI